MNWPGAAIFIGGVLTGVVGAILTMALYEGMHILQRSLDGISGDIHNVMSAQQTLKGVVNANTEELASRLGSIEESIAAIPAKTEVIELPVDTTQQNLESRSV
jgi:hypothetical protein